MMIGLADESGAGPNSLQNTTIAATPPETAPHLNTLSPKPPPMLYDICSRTDVGRTRDNNEDAVSFDASNGLCVLADGMGGYNAGEIASGLATAFIQTELGRWLNENAGKASSKQLRRALEISILNANHSILSAAASTPQYAGMGTTVVVCHFDGNRLLIGHIGDSRCYRLRGRELRQLTKDHSLLQERLDAGHLTPEQALTSTDRFLVTRALGVEDLAEVEVAEHRVESGDLYLMCSDGLNDMVPDAHITALLQQSLPLPQKAEHLINAANEAGGRDNISVVLVQAGQWRAKRSLLARLLGK
jgi:protein phosphatase